MDNKARIKNKVLAVLARMRPYLQADGGDVRLLEITDEGTVKVQLTGTCKNCPYRQQTLAGIEQAIVKEVSEVKKLETPEH
ncbi:MAG: NifU family protein [Bacteroidales bacterium]|nr:NifU family protein [Bacteroidales bacterium]